MVDLTPKVNTEVPPKPASAPSTEAKVTSAEKPKASLFDGLNLVRPSSQVFVNGYGVSTNNTVMLNKNGSFRLTDSVSGAVGANVMHNYTRFETEHAALNLNSSMAGASLQTNATIIPSLKLSASSGLNYMTNYQGYNQLKANPQLGATFAKSTDTGSAGINATAFTGNNIEITKTGLNRTPYKGVSVNGGLKLSLDKKNTLYAQGGVSQFESTMPPTNASQPGMPNYGGSVVSSRTYSGSLGLQTSSNQYVNLMASSTGDNLGNKFKMAGVGYQIGRTAVNANVAKNAAGVEGNINVIYAWE